MVPEEYMSVLLIFFLVIYSFCIAPPTALHTSAFRRQNNDHIMKTEHREGAGMRGCGETLLKASKEQLGSRHEA